MSEDHALGELLSALKRADYRFAVVTPATHARVLARPFGGIPDLREVFGWSRPFAAGDLPQRLFDLLDKAGAVERDGPFLRSKLRVASLGDDLFLHSAFPTDTDDAVFFGPDSYRFARFIEQHMPLHRAPIQIVDMGAGSGAGGVVAARRAPTGSLTLVDVNPAALRLARINAAVAGVDAATVQSDRIPPGADLILANPPYMIDGQHRAYRDGGDLLGGAVALDWVEQSLKALAPGGTLLLYTGAAVTGGRTPLSDAIEQACATAGASCAIEEIDPDVFGEELDLDAYAEVERIAAIGAVISRQR